MIKQIVFIFIVALSSLNMAAAKTTTLIPEATTAKACTVVFRRDVLGLKDMVKPLDVRVHEYEGIRLTVTSTFVSSDQNWLVLRDYRIPRDVILFVSGC